MKILHNTVNHEQLQKIKEEEFNEEIKKKSRQAREIARKNAKQVD